MDAPLQIKEVVDRDTQVINQRSKGGVMAVRMHANAFLGCPEKVDTYEVTLSNGDHALLIKPFKLIG